MQTVLTIVAAVLIGAAVSQRPSLRDDVRRSGAPVEKQYRVLPEPQSISRLLEKSDLIVRGVVGRTRGSYLTADESDVRTDVLLTASEILYDRSLTSDLGDAIHGVPLTVVQLGGTVMINGHAATVRHVDSPALKPGAEVVIFLIRAGERYEIASDYFGVFGVQAGVIRPLGDSGVFDQRIRDGLSLSEFRAEIDSARVSVGR